LSIDKIYPNSNPDFLCKSEERAAGTSPEEFTGYIPVEELEITASRSSGPGGQNVNKVNSKVEIRFHLESATWLPDRVKAKLAENEQGRITKHGYFVIRSEATRKQLMNQADCLHKLRGLVYRAQADSQTRGPSAEDVQKLEERRAKAKAGILKEKRMKSLRKQAKRMDM